MNFHKVKLSDLKPDPQNLREHPQANIQMIAAAIGDIGVGRSGVVDEDLRILAGNGAYEALERAGVEDVLLVETDGNTWVVVQRNDLTEDQKRLLALYDNRAGELSCWNLPALKALAVQGDPALSAVFTPEEIHAFGKLDFPEAPDRLKAHIVGDSLPRLDDPNAPSLADRFLVPPFSVLDSRQGYWQERKEFWRGQGVIDGGREDSLTYNQDSLDKIKGDGAIGGSGTSAFDPVLAELAYRWFIPKGGIVFDPFSGGVVRGAVAALLGRHYMGIDINPVQIDANRAQWQVICKQRQDAPPAPAWHCRDARNPAPLKDREKADFVFTCPPYWNLERYTDNPEDLSNMDLINFQAAYRDCLANAISRLKKDRFAVIVVGEARAKNGGCIGLSDMTTQLMRDCGLTLHNEAIFVTPAGSLPIRAASQFLNSRKLGRCHQKMMVYCLGDVAQATQYAGNVEIEIEAEGEKEDEPANVSGN